MTISASGSSQSATSANDRLFDAYQTMSLIRGVEERLLSLFSEGLVNGTVHTCVGQEVCAVGVVGVLEPSRDVVWSNHRGHGHYLTYTDDVDGLVAEVMGRSSGVCKGIGGSQHLHRGGYYSNGVLGGTAPCAVGCAMAEKIDNTGAVSVVFLGDGAMAEGAVYESMNIAALWNLPVLFVVEHNQFAQTTPTELEQAGDLSRRAEPFGIDSSEMRADDVLAVQDHVAAVVEGMRSNPAPHFLLLHTYRLNSHSKGDDTRTVEELATLRQKDPLALLMAELDGVDQTRREEIDQVNQDRISSAVSAALSSPALTLEEFETMSAQW